MFARLGNAKPNTENTEGFKWALINLQGLSKRISTLSRKELNKIP